MIGAVSNEWELWLRREQAAGRTITDGEWERLKAYYDYRCLCCGHREQVIYNPDTGKCAGMLTKDHVIPHAKGGQNTIHNLQPLCYGCNKAKGQRTIDYRPSIRWRVRKVVM